MIITTTLGCFQDHTLDSFHSLPRPPPPMHICLLGGSSSINQMRWYGMKGLMWGARQADHYVHWGRCQHQYAIVIVVAIATDAFLSSSLSSSSSVQQRFR